MSFSHALADGTSPGGKVSDAVEAAVLCSPSSAWYKLLNNPIIRFIRAHGTFCAVVTKKVLNIGSFSYLSASFLLDPSSDGNVLANNDARWLASSLGFVLAAVMLLSTIAIVWGYLLSVNRLGGSLNLYIRCFWPQFALFFMAEVSLFIPFYYYAFTARSIDCGDVVGSGFCLGAATSRMVELPISFVLSLVSFLFLLGIWSTVREVATPVRSAKYAAREQFHYATNGIVAIVKRVLTDAVLLTEVVVSAVNGFEAHRQIPVLMNMAYVFVAMMIASSIASVIVTFRNWRHQRNTLTKAGFVVITLIYVTEAIVWAAGVIYVAKSGIPYSFGFAFIIASTGSGDLCSYLHVVTLYRVPSEPMKTTDMELKERLVVV